MSDSLNQAELPQAALLPTSYGERGEIRDLISKGLLRRWHIQYFFDTLLHQLLGNTRLCSDAQEKLNPNTFRNKLTGSFKDKAEERLLQLGKEGGGGRIMDLPRVRDISPKEFYRQYVIPNKPVV
ncbi:MAG: hypothetical protein ACHQVK_02600, partial [Candidatus Paceibacterales bacterium]